MTEIERLKREARKALLEFRYEAEGYDCGNSVLKEINPRAAAAADDFNRACDRLAELDPEYPTQATRL